MTTLKPPTLPFPVQSDRLILRPFVEDDAVHVAKRMHEYHDGILPESFLLQEARNYLNYLRTQHAPNHLTIAMFADDALVGEIDAKQHADDRRAWNIGYRVMPKHQGNRFAAEGVEALKDVFKTSVNATRFSANVANWNAESLAVMNRTGFSVTYTDKDVTYFECRL